ncbi:MAG TPA: hypothetical protein VGD76_17035, partial [Ramlibacter sp.]
REAMARATLFEEHASVLPHWVAQGLRDATIVCLDAHLDLQFIAPERIARLRACRGAAEVARLESAHPLSPLRDACYGIEDFLYAAGQLGVLRRLVWVAPPHVLARMDTALQALRQMEGVTRRDIASFRRTGGCVEGRLLGIDIAVLEWQQLPSLGLEAPLAVDIDADYFVRVPQDRIWARPRVIVTALKERLGEHVDLTVARSVGTGFLPLRHRFLADQLAALWEGRQDDARHWQRLLELEVDPLPEAERVARLSALLAERPDCAATCHALALATPVAEERTLLLERAATLDAHYRGDVLRHLGSLRAREQDLDLATIVRLHRQLDTWDGAPARVATAWVALGLLYATFGRVAEAIACDTQSRRQGGGHPDLALQIGRLLMAAGRDEAAVPWLERAAMDDETRAAAWLHLSVCASRRGALEEAWNWGRAASEAAPAWPEPVRWLDSLSGQPGYDWASAARSSTG